MDGFSEKCVSWNRWIPTQIFILSLSQTCVFQVWMIISNPSKISRFQWWLCSYNEHETCTLLLCLIYQTDAFLCIPWIALFLSQFLFSFVKHQPRSEPVLGKAWQIWLCPSNLKNYNIYVLLLQTVKLFSY